MRLPWSGHQCREVSGVTQGHPGRYRRTCPEKDVGEKREIPGRPNFMADLH
jgi:hypothetical protein